MTSRPAPVPDRPRPGADPFLDLLARMVRTAHENERARRGNLRVVEGGKDR